MEWFVFLLMGTIWIFFFYLVRENPSFFRVFPFSIITLVLGILFSTGVNFPSGATSTTVGSVVTQVITYTTYSASLVPGATNVPILWAIQWSFIAFGMVGLVYSFVLAYRTFLQPDKEKF